MDTQVWFLFQDQEGMDIGLFLHSIRMKDTRHHQKRLLCRATPIKRGYPRPLVH
jgi:hypothetical protein